MKMNESFLARMREAAKLLQTSGPAAATEAIKAALTGEQNTHTSHAVDLPRKMIDINPAPGKVDSGSSAEENIRPDSFGVEAAKAPSSAFGKHTSFLERFRNLPGMNKVDFPMGPALGDNAHAEADHSAEEKTGGRFLTGSCSNQAGTRSYKLYIPASYHGEPLPLIVMLHGCKQNPDDFAAGTGMNRLAEKNHCIVVYPAQAQAANGSNCWNWFNPSDQEREKGEPSIIADITRQVMRDYRIDPKRVYVAGLSAGAAMAAILAAAYPELYAAVGIHSGLPVGSANNVASAFGAMKEGGKAVRLDVYRRPVPAIVFHGDRDQTVHPGNGNRALAQSMAQAAENTGAGIGANAMQDKKVIKGQVPNGRAYTRTIFSDAGDSVLAEHWTVHGSGHAWSGGSKRGSYTDPQGPDASDEMLRFFYAHPLSPT